MSFAAASDNATPESVIAGMLGVLRVMADRFIDSFGAPAALIKGGAVYGKTRDRILRWLHDMEFVVRRMLLLRAALFPAPPPSAATKISTGARRPKEGDAAALFGPNEESSQWRVAFRMPYPPEAISMRGGVSARADSYVLGHRVDPAQKGAGASRLADIGYWADDPRPLAERFEALRRIIEDPDHYAARLAQRLHRWRGRVERRAIFLQTLCARAPISNEAGLPDEDWNPVALARDLALALIPVFAGLGAVALGVCDSS